MSTKKTGIFDIENGPSRDTLFDACKYAYSKTANVTVEFAVAVGYTAPKDHPGCAYIAAPMKNVRISSIEHEDGSGESFVLQGYCEADLAAFGKADATYTSYRLTAYYNSKTRKGRITFW